MPFLFGAKESQGFKKMMLDLEKWVCVTMFFYRSVKYTNFSWSWKKTQNLADGIGASEWRVSENHRKETRDCLPWSLIGRNGHS